MNRLAAALPGSLPAPQAIKEPRQSSAKTSLAAGEAEFQQQTDSRDGGSPTHKAKQRHRALHTHIVVNSREHTDLYGYTETPVPWKQNSFSNQENQAHTTRTEKQNPVMQTPCS